MSVDTINRNHVVGIVLGFEIKNQRRISNNAQSSRRKQRSLITMGSIFPKHSPRRPGTIGKVIWHVIQSLLDSMRSFETA
jgi:hypothetical protein